jgi:hypothetical protein
MDDYADIYYVDTRNAVRDHRVQGGGARPSASASVPWRPVAPAPQAVYAPPPTQAPIYAQPTQGYMLPQQQYVLAQQQTPFGSLFGKLTTGQVIEMVAQLFAALQPLPAAPVPTRSGDTDSGNNILFQDALAKHAKRDEQIRTVGALVAKLIG